MPTTLTGLPTSWREGESPSGDRMVYVRTQDLNRSNISTKYAAIREWADTNGFVLEPIGYDLIAYNTWCDFYYWTGFKLTEGTGGNGRLFNPYPCPGCGHEMDAGTGLCPDCTHINSCEACNVFGLTLYTEVGQDGHGFCGRCARACTTCDSYLPSSSAFERCSTCDERIACAGCRQVRSMSDTTERNDSHYCATCITNFCEECETYDANRAALTLDGVTRHLCKTCATKVYDEQRERLEAWSIEEMPVSGSLLIPSSPSRPVRTISIETEFDGDGAEVTRALHKAGLLPAPNMDQSHTAQPNNMTHPCLMKRDGTVSGGELVTYLLDLDNDNHAEALLRMTEVMKGCRDMNFARFSRNAGGHIHIDWHGYTMRDAWASYTLFQYLQRPLYYMAGAGAEYGHRSIQGNTFGSAPNAGPFGSLRNFALNFPGGRDGLNMGNWTASRRQCQCGAFQAGEWSDCNCNLGKATAEWRLWNAEITPRILHAWIALMQAITAYAQSVADKDFDETKYPYLLWERRELTATASASIRDIKTRLEWMHRTLPLTIHERDSIIYTAKKSHLSVLGDPYLDGLLDIANESALGEGKKKAPNPASRKRTKFKLKKLSAAATLTDAQINALVEEGWEIADMTEAGVTA